MPDSTPRLTTFLISHFSEKARWSLDLLKIPYRERRLLIGLHLLTTRKLAPKSSVPIFEHAGKVVQGSSEILDHLATLGHSQLEPSAEHSARSRDLEELANLALGRAVQCVTYDVLLHDRVAVSQLYSLQGPFWARAFYSLLFSRMAPRIRQMYRITPEGVLESKQRFRDAIAELDRALDGKRYFFDDRPTRLDLSVSALIAPLYRPAEHPVPWPALLPELAEFAAQFADSATVQHMRRMYRDHRR